MKIGGISISDNTIERVAEETGEKILQAEEEKFETITECVENSQNLLKTAEKMGIAVDGCKINTREEGFQRGESRSGF